MADHEHISRASGLEPDAEMNIIGFIVGIGSLLMFLPLAPFLAVLWVFDRLTGSDPGDRAEDRTERRVVEDSDERAESRVEA